MANSNGLMTKVVAVLDKVKSRLNIKSGLDSIKDLFVTVTAKLNLPASKKQLKSDLSKLPEQSVQISGKLNTAQTKKNLKSGLKNTGDFEVKVAGDLDTSKTKSNINKKLKGIDTDATVNLGVSGSENATGAIDSAGKASTGLFAKLKVGSEIIRALGIAAKQAVSNVKELDKACPLLSLQLIPCLR